MKALILTAGYGTRLRPLTFFKPKCLIEINGKPVLEHLVEYLESYGITEIIVNLHYKGDQIMKRFKGRLLYFYEPKLLGEEGTIRSLKDWLKNDYTVVMNGDTLTNLDLNMMFNLSKGKNIRSMEGNVYTGVEILSPDYFTGDHSFVNYFDKTRWWVDMGTFKGLSKARQIMKDVKTISNLSKMSN